jgi:hypothetical protein
VSVEASIHKALREFAQAVFDEHGIQIHRVDLDWLDRSSMAERAATVMLVRVDSSTRA